jgi:rubrerythrin
MTIFFGKILYIWHFNKSMRIYMSEKKEDDSNYDWNALTECPECGYAVQSDCDECPVCEKKIK